MIFAERAPGLGLALVGLLLTGALGCVHPAPPAAQAVVESGVQGAALPLPQAMAVLQGAADSLDPALRGPALAALVRSSPQAGGGEWSARGLYDPSPRVRRDVADALVARLPEEPSRQILLGLAARTEVDPLTTCMALLALAPGDASVGAQAAQVATRSRSVSQALPCWLAGTAAGDAQAATQLQDALARGVLKLDLPLLLGLARTPSPAISQGMAEGLDRVEELGRGAAAAVLLGHGDPRGEAHLRRILSQGPVEAAMEAIDFLAALDVPGADPLLARAAHGPRGRVSTYAGLARLAHGEVSGAALRQATQADQDELLVLALRCAGLGLRRYPDSGPVHRAARRLARVGLQRERERVQVATAALVGALGELDLGVALGPWLDADDPQVRLATAMAVSQLQAAPRKGLPPS